MAGAICSTTRRISRHLNVLWPEHDGDLAAFMQQLTNTHVKRWKEHRHETEFGPLYQARYKSFPVQTEGYFHREFRYVERNALRANLVERAEQWRWSSLCLDRSIGSTSPTSGRRRRN